MNSIDLLQILLSIGPCLIVGGIAYYFFKDFVRNEENRRHYEMRRETSKEIIPYRIQALERMTLYLERIDPGSLLVRVKPNDSDKYEYETELIQIIEKEFEHNLTQQIYLSSKCWDAIRATKNATIALIRKTNMHEQITTPDQLRELVLTELLDKDAPSATGLAYIKKEAREMW